MSDGIVSKINWSNVSTPMVSNILGKSFSLGPKCLNANESVFINMCVEGCFSSCKSTHNLKINLSFTNDFFEFIKPLYFV